MDQTQIMGGGRDQIMKNMNSIIVHKVGPSSGTTAVTQLPFGSEGTFFAVDTIGLFARVVSINESPRSKLPSSSLRMEVEESLERSLKNHAATWEELSKY
jgi:hypothetical protein